MTAVAISADGRFAAISVEGEVAVWDIQLKQKIRSFAGHTRTVNKLLFDAQRHPAALGLGRRHHARVALEKLPEMIDWARANRQYPQLTCNQEKLYGLELKHC